MTDFDELDTEALRALVMAVTDDLLRLCAVIGAGDTDGAQADATVLTADWAWKPGTNTYSDGTVIVATDTRSHIYAPPHRRGTDV